MNGPIFILMTSARCGSTWLQRMITATGQALIWGEHNLYKRLHLDEPFDGDAMWTEPEGTNGANPDDLKAFRARGPNMWMALVLPPKRALREGAKAFIEAVFARTASEGFRRWGFKVSAWDGEFVSFLKESWPEAKILYLVRHPVCCLQSEFQNLGHYQAAFIDNWIAKTEYALHAFDKNERLAVYEELKDGGLAGLWEWLGLEGIDESVNSTWISTPFAYLPLRDEDRAAVEFRVETLNELCHALGLEPACPDRMDRSKIVDVNAGKLLSYRNAKGENVTCQL